jgi:coenzyme F420-0:L-glutamate ligase / coenzyme F420-1:gamma-L-glutamate ligase
VPPPSTQPHRGPPTTPRSQRQPPAGHLEITAPDGVGEVVVGDDLAGLLLGHTETAGPPLTDGDIVVVTSKVISKAEGRVRIGEPSASLAEESTRVLASRGNLAIVRTRLGITQATAGIDGSNVAPGSHAMLPLDPDASARTIRTRVRQRIGVNVGVLVSDTAGRAWRIGQTDIAIGAAGLRLVEDYVGHHDDHGNVLTTTQPCVADELCSAAELGQTKTGRRPFAVIRGRADLVTEPDDAGESARRLNRPTAEDLFGFGAREAVIRAARAQHGDSDGFGEPASAGELIAVLAELVGGVRITVEVPGSEIHVARPPRDRNRLDQVADDRVADDPLAGGVVALVAFAHGWVVAAPIGGDQAGSGWEVRLVRLSP